MAKKKTGRRLTLDAAKSKKVVRAMLNGLPLKRAAECASVHYDTIRRWLNRGRKDLESGRDTPFRNFYVDVRKAGAEAENIQAAMIIKTAKKTWTAAAWYLERRHPERWGRRDVPIPPKQPEQGTLTGSRTALPSPEELLQRLIEVMGKEAALAIIAGMNGEQKRIEHSNGSPSNTNGDEHG